MYGRFVLWILMLYIVCGWYTPDYKRWLAPLEASLDAIGATNITGGITWGWRLLSPGAPFTEGRSYSEEDNHKVLVLMTDGENTYYPNGTFNKSTYGSWGYLSLSAEHFGSYITSQNAIQARIDTRSKAACDNIKAQTNITIYTIAFDVNTERGQELMQYCASDPTKAYDAENEEELLAAFDAIGTDISKLRLEE